MRLKTTLDQWLTLSEVEAAGSIQAAAKSLNKSHTTLLYTVRKLEEQLGLTLLEVKGRKSVLTTAGKALLRRSRSMLEQAHALENSSALLAENVEAEIIVGIDHLCDRSWLYAPLATFIAENSVTSVRVIETSLSKTEQMVKAELTDLSIINIPVTNAGAEAFGSVSMVPIVSAHHPIAEYESVTLSELAALQQIVVTDLGACETHDVGWLKSSQRITVDTFDHAWDAVISGVGYCRFPEHMLARYANDAFHRLLVEGANKYQVPLHLTLPKGEKTGPAARRLYALLSESVNRRDNL
ncbi:LysR family transcriptional regulator [Neptunomonas sp. XY-337]|uniref:LysR family transcriptional regulator n=1 Tax=Neptunomonas sp. XY-337 TaxID=2561897 RepID=UPI0010A9CBA0|nr:LysR family transcriptional regulator [Neptunomonas sp. XY-337]